MDPRVTTKDITIDDKSFRLSKMDARLACWLFATLGANASSSGLLLSTLGSCTHAQFDEIQGHALRHVMLLDNKDGNVFPVPILSGEGKFADPSLGTDGNLVFRLTSESIMFNVAPFLPEPK
jgi:hypothetical protein